MARARVLALLVFLSGWMLARTAAASMVLAKPDGDVRIGRVHVALSSGPVRSVAWEQLHLSEARGELAWLVAVPRGGFLEPADDHFFESLDEATAPVIAPAKSLQCGAASESTAAPRGTLVRPVSTAYAPLAPSAALEKLAALGYVIDAPTRAAVLSLDAIGEDVAILILPPGPRGLTRTARVLGPATRAFPLTLAPASRMLAFVLSSGRARFAGLPFSEVDQSKLSWASNRSNHDALLAAAIAAAAPGAVTVFAGVDGVFVDQVAGGGSIPSLLRRYLAGEVITPAIVECIARISPLGFSSKPVAPSCAKASPWMPGATPPPCSIATGDQLPASDLACGALDDFAALLGGHTPSRVALTRLEGMAAPTPRGRALELLTLGSLPSYREADLGPLCTDPGSQPGSPGPTQPPSTSNPAPASDAPVSEPSSSSSSSSSSGGCNGQVFLDSCARSSSSSDSCSGDSSSSDSCSGDSSDGSDGCSGGAGDSADDGCGSSSGSGGACKGASDSADDGCRAARRAPRPRFSAVLYLLIAAAAIGRRLGRGPCYASHPERRWPPSHRPREMTSNDAPSRE